MSGANSRTALSSYIAIACLCLIAPIVIVIVLAFGGEGYLAFSADIILAELVHGVLRRHALAPVPDIEHRHCGDSLRHCNGDWFSSRHMPSSEVRCAAKKLVLSLMLMPIIVPTVITAIAMYFVTAKLGMVGNVLWIGFCHAIVALPIVLLILLSALQGVDVNLERAGPGPRCQPRARLFQGCRDPIAFPGIMSAALFAFLASFDELVISLFLAGVRNQTLPVRIWNSLHLEIEPVIAAAATFLIAVTGLVLLADAGMRRLRGRAPVNS